MEASHQNFISVQPTEKKKSTSKKHKKRRCFKRNKIDDAMASQNLFMLQSPLQEHNIGVNSRKDPLT